MLELAQYRLGESSEDIVLQSSQDNQQAALAMVQQAHLHIDIFSHDLEPRLYDNADFADAIKAFVLKGNHPNQADRSERKCSRTRIREWDC